ncbi:MAG: cupin domain-containing protein, partial [Deltaproteobacteria bacterium]|nr:cupin domain-containing protein [Deltaproteobacteria bacterium]
MRHLETKSLRHHNFKPLHATRTSQAAMMTLRPGTESTEDSSNEHAWAEQWLYVVSGSGSARVGKRTVKLREGSVVLISRREPHSIKNTGRKNLVTFNVYARPAYDPEGEPLR